MPTLIKANHRWSYWLQKIIEGEELQYWNESSLSWEPLEPHHKAQLIDEDDIPHIKVKADIKNVVNYLLSDECTTYKFNTIEHALLTIIKEANYNIEFVNVVKDVYPNEYREWFKHYEQEVDIEPLIAQQGDNRCKLFES